MSDHWAAIEQALREYGEALLGGTPGEVAAARQKHAKAVGEAKRRENISKSLLEDATNELRACRARESELERERDDLQRKIDGYFLSSEFAWWVEKAEKAEARVAEAEKQEAWLEKQWGLDTERLGQAKERVAELERALRDEAERQEDVASRYPDSLLAEHANRTAHLLREALGARREATGE